eukprot:scaffold8_cov142-Skeletonema_marinoi.AAC.10
MQAPPRILMNVGSGSNGRKNGKYIGSVTLWNRVWRRNGKCKNGDGEVNVEEFGNYDQRNGINDINVGQVDGLRDGKGILNMENGAIYDGQLMGGLPHGEGICTWTNGDRYEGDWDRGTRHGKGIYKRANGDVFDGEFKVNLRHGKGKYIWTNGDVYDGEWRLDEQHGKGTMKCKDGTFYSMQFKDGLAHGEGTYKRSDGSIYHGEVRGGLIHGRGKMKYRDGSEYTGQFVFGRMHGEGKMKYKYGSEYIGDFSANKRHGKGKMKYRYGCFIYIGQYIGQWIEGKRHGLGTQTSMWKISRYHGGWRYDKKHGKGITLWFEYEKLPGMPILFVLLLCLVGFLWHYPVAHCCDFVHVWGVWVMLWLWAFRELRRDLADVKATEPKEEEPKYDEKGDSLEVGFRLDQDHIHCGICYEAFTTDVATTDPGSRGRLPAELADEKGALEGGRRVFNCDGAESISMEALIEAQSTSYEIFQAKLRLALYRTSA